MKCVVFHTVKSTADKKRIVKDAPFLCKDKPEELKEWLGDGYYFWECFEELAHWWGKVHYKGKYVICKTFFHCKNKEVLDLVGNTSQMREMTELVAALKADEGYQEDEFSAQFVINFLKTNTYKPFVYKAIRVYSQECSSDKEVNDTKLFFNKRSFINLCPEIQICVLDKTTLDLPMRIFYCSEKEAASSLTV